MVQEKREAPTDELVAENNGSASAPSKKAKQSGGSNEAKSKPFSKRDNKNTEWKPRLDENGNPVPKSERLPKKKVAVMIGYCGSGYNGMQIQNNPDVKTIEAEIFKAFIESGAVSKENSTDLKKNGFMRAARTDKGVHAAGNVVSCKLILEDEDIMAKINSHLPDQIRVWGIERVNRSFDCRKLCSSRIYEYLLPTHSLLPPRPKSSLYNLIEASRKEHPGILRDDPDVEWWSTTRERIVETGVTQEELEQVFEKTAEVTEDTKKEYYGEDGEVTEWGKLVKKIRGVENECRRDYRVSKEKLELFRSAMKQYEGSHNFHNFTLGKTYKDPSARRFMKGTSVSEPFTIEGTEWISIKIHGQSFMLHQIRKMICMASLVVRTGCPITRISDCFGPAKINIPKAPALGLLLECPVYETYNEKLEDMGYNKLDFSRYNTEMDAFKMKYIYDKIYGEEIKENVYHGFFEFLDTFKGSGATKEGKHIFDFLGAAFNNGLENKETVKGDVPAKAADNID